MADMKEIEVQRTEYQLTLNQEEVAVLKTLLSNVGGPVSGPRGIIENISSALWKTKVPESRCRVERCPGERAGIYLYDEEDCSHAG